MVYELGLLTDAELRIMQVYTLFKDGIKPWEWDYENYSGENESMKGMFYQDDWHDVRTIDSMIADREGTAVARARGQTGR